VLTDGVLLELQRPGSGLMIPYDMGRSKRVITATIDLTGGGLIKFRPIMMGLYTSVVISLL
jgi:hypothetical protein